MDDHRLQSKQSKFDMTNNSKIVEANESKGTRNNVSPNQTVELLHNANNRETPTPSRKSVHNHTTLDRVSKEDTASFFKQPVVSSMVGGPRNPENEYSLNEIRSELVPFRGIDFKKKDLLDMRSIMHQKIEQLMDNSPLWATMMPVKIFKDLVNFVGDASGQLQAQLQSF